MLNFLLGRDNRNDPRLAIFPQAIDGRQVIYPRMPFRLIATLIDLLIILFVIMPFISLIDRALPEDPKAKLFQQKVIEYQQKYPNNPRIAYEELTKDPEIIINNNVSLTPILIFKQIFQFSLFTTLLLAYVILCHRKLGGTVGKKLLGLKIVDSTTYQPISVKRLIIRCFACSFTLLTFMIGYIMAYFNLRKITLHDYIMKTVVIKLGKKLDNN